MLKYPKNDAVTIMLFRSLASVGILSTAILTGCSSSSNSSDPQTIAISGLKYVLESGSEGTTSSEGLIPSASGNVQFYLGNAKIGPAVPANQDALFNALRDYFPASQIELNATMFEFKYRGRGRGILEYSPDFYEDAANTYEVNRNRLSALSNIMQLLLSFDSDKDPSNGIQLEASIHEIIDQADLEFAYYPYSLPEDVADNVKDLKLWLYAAHQQNLISNQALFSPEVALSWAATQLIPDFTVYALSQKMNTTATMP